MEGFENGIEYFERMVADNPDNPTGLLALANEYQKAGRYEDEEQRRWNATSQSSATTRATLTRAWATCSHASGAKTRHGPHTRRASGRPRSMATAAAYSGTQAATCCLRLRLHAHTAERAD